MSGILFFIFASCDPLAALLGLSVVFDPLDHSILLNRRETTFGVGGTVVHWFSLYVSERIQSVIVNGSVSDHCPLLYGVLQGSVLGPLSFTFCSQPLSDVVGQHNCSFHKYGVLYGDDTELSESCLLEDFKCTKLSIQECITAISCWMDSNKLMRYNADKTEVSIVGTASRIEQLDCGTIQILDYDISFQKSVKYLGVRMDQTLSTCISDHISDLCRSSFLSLRRISSIALNWLKKRLLAL